MEQWRDIPGTGDRQYQVSSGGAVRSLPCTVMRRDGRLLRMAGSMLRAKPNSRGYPRVSIWDGHRQVTVTVHSLVAAAFLLKPPGRLGTHRGEWTVNHKDGNKANNCAENLEYITCSENYAHAKKTDLLSHLGERNGRAKVTQNQVEAIRAAYKGGATQVTLAAQYRIDQTQVSRIVRGASWGHGSSAQPGG